MKWAMAERLTLMILIIIMATNVFILIRIQMLTNVDTVLREKKVSYVLPYDSYAVEKKKISWDQSASAPMGWVVRYARSGCMYCMLDFEWERLLAMLEHYNYHTIIALPRESGRIANASAISEHVPQMAFVKMDWIKQFRFTATPSVIIFNNEGRILWSHVGMMSDTDYKSAKKAIGNN
jgi:hypothetical protein